MMGHDSSAAGRDDGTQHGYDWTQTYERWQSWEDPDDALKRRQEEAARMRNFREHNMTCAHDRSAERKVMEMPIEEKLEACREFRRKGNLFHEEGQYRRAALQYRQALVYYDFCFPDEDKIQRELDEIRQACLLNSAACFLRCRELDETLDCCYQALQAEPDNVKALYRRAVVYRLRDQFREAAVDLGKALSKRPNDVMLRKESALLKSKIASYRESSKAISQQIFRGLHAAGGGAEVTSDSQIENTSSCLDMIGTDYTLGTPGGGTTARVMGGGYKVAAAGLNGGSGDGEEAGRQRHDLSLPVLVDLSELEEIAGCAWPTDEC